MLLCERLHKGSSYIRPRRDLSKNKDGMCVIQKLTEILGNNARRILLFRLG